MLHLFGRHTTCLNLTKPHPPAMHCNAPVTMLQARMAPWLNSTYTTLKSGTKRTRTMCENTMFNTAMMDGFISQVRHCCYHPDCYLPP